MSAFPHLKCSMKRALAKDMQPAQRQTLSVWRSLLFDDAEFPMESFMCWGKLFMEIWFIFKNNFFFFFDYFIYLPNCLHLLFWLVDCKFPLLWRLWNETTPAKKTKKTFLMNRHGVENLHAKKPGQKNKKKAEIITITEMAAARMQGLN